MWNYAQASGKFSHNGAEIGVGYSGSGAGKNNPNAENEENEGPIPQGVYRISGPLCTSEQNGGSVTPCPDCGGVTHHTHGPYIFRLTPDPSNEMFGRSGFLIHGDSIAAPGTASKGCIIMGPAIRSQIRPSQDDGLTVTD